MKPVIPTADALKLEIHKRQLMAYSDALIRQKTFVKDRIKNDAPDRLLLVEHPAVITLGRSGSLKDLKCSKEQLDKKKIQVRQVSRGGMATFHGPGQLVAYPLIRISDQDLHNYLKKLLNVLVTVLGEFNLEPELKFDAPGLWVNGAKIASVGIAVEKWVTYHGIALNVNTDLKGFDLIIPCGKKEERITSMKEVLGCQQDLDAVEDAFVDAFCRQFNYTPVKPVPLSKSEKPSWLKKGSGSQSALFRMNLHLRSSNLASVCEQAHCPNLGECFSRGTATFMILGDICTRSCRFCAVQKGSPKMLDPLEPERLAKTVHDLNLEYVVITSVTRDDLPDGGANHFADTIAAVRKYCPGTPIEVLTPDFNGSARAVQAVIEVRPDMFNHNVETVPRLYSKIRPQADYQQSLEVLQQVAKAGLAVKSGLMLGLGEAADEIITTLEDLFRTGCRYLTLGQYLAPSDIHVPVERYLSPQEFKVWAEIAEEIGFTEVAAGPLVRSSYRADRMGPGRTGKGRVDKAP